MATVGHIWEAVKEGFSESYAKSLSHWVEKVFDFHSGGFVEHTASYAVALLIVTAIVGLVGARHRMWGAIHRRWCAATIRSAAGTAFVIVRCPIANDNGDSIGNEISARLETAFRSFAGWDDAAARPFEVMEFPLALPADEGTKAYDKGIETAKRWLEKTNGDILIWGKRVNEDSVGIVRLIGKDRKKGIIEARRINFDKRANDFDDALANAIAYEAAQLTQTTLSEPGLFPLNALRKVSDKLQKLSRADAPAISSEWRHQMADEHWRLTQEIARRTESPEECADFETIARTEIARLDPVQRPRRFAEVSLRISLLARKRNWIDPNPQELDEALSLLETAIPIFESTGAARQAAEAALERVQIRRQHFIFAEYDEAKDDAVYTAVFHEAKRLVGLANEDALSARLTAASFSYPIIERIADVSGFTTNGPSVAFELVDRVAPYLDNQELVDFAWTLSNSISRCGDRLQSTQLWHAGPQIIKGILESRSSWTMDELRLLKSMLGSEAILAGLRLGSVGPATTAAPYYDLANRLAVEVDDSFDWGHGNLHRYVDLRTLSLFGCGPEDKSHLLERTVAAFRICLGTSFARFPTVQYRARTTLVMVLNNNAAAFGSLKAAEEAQYHLSALHLNNAMEMYLAAFSAWQVARLSPQGDSVQRTERGRQAHLITERALQQAIEEKSELYTAKLAEILRLIEADFPNLAVDVETAAAAIRDESAEADIVRSMSQPASNQEDY
jgi:hypothetical protein